MLIYSFISFQNLLRILETLKRHPSRFLLDKIVLNVFNDFMVLNSTDLLIRVRYSFHQ
jgi:hypothetical protein